MMGGSPEIRVFLLTVAIGSLFGWNPDLVVAGVAITKRLGDKVGKQRLIGPLRCLLRPARHRNAEQGEFRSDLSDFRMSQRM
jgi:hypothetical protein